MVIDLDLIPKYYQKEILRNFERGKEVKAKLDKGDYSSCCMCPRFGSYDCNGNSCDKCYTRINYLIEPNIVKILTDNIPHAKDHIILVDDDNPNIGYIGDGFMEDRTVEDLNLPAKLENEVLELYDFEVYVDENHHPDPNDPDDGENKCLKFKIRMKDI